MLRTLAIIGFDIDLAALLKTVVSSGSNYFATSIDNPTVIGKYSSSADSLSLGRSTDKPRSSSTCDWKVRFGSVVCYPDCFREIVSYGDNFRKRESFWIFASCFAADVAIFFLLNGI